MLSKAHCKTDQSKQRDVQIRQASTMEEQEQIGVADPLEERKQG